MAGDGKDTMMNISELQMHASVAEYGREAARLQLEHEAKRARKADKGESIRIRRSHNPFAAIVRLARRSGSVRPTAPSGSTR